MLKLTKTGIGLLTKQYRSVLRKCLLINVGLFVSTIFLLCSEQQDALATITYENYDRNLVITTHSSYYADNGLFIKDITTGGMVAQLFNDGMYSSDGTTAGSGSLALYSQGSFKTILNANYFKLNGSAISATGIVANTIQNSTALITSGGVYDALNYYYTFRGDKTAEHIDFTKELNDDILSFKMKELQFQNPTRLGAFIKCDEACPRLSERFASSSQEQMFKNDASNDAGTSRHCLRQFGDVLANLLKNMASKYAKMNDFMNVEVCHA